MLRPCLGTFLNSLGNVNMPVQYTRMFLPPYVVYTFPEAVFQETPEHEQKVRRKEACAKAKDTDNGVVRAIRLVFVFWDQRCGWLDALSLFLYVRFKHLHTWRFVWRSEPRSSCLTEAIPQGIDLAVIKREIKYGVSDLGSRGLLYSGLYASRVRLPSR